MKKIAVIGIGNPLRSDDGLGIVLLEKLIENKNDFSKDIDFLDGGTGGFNLLHDLSKYEKVLILDAVDMGKKAGESLFFNINELKSKKIDINISTHETDFLKIVALSEKLDEKPSEIFIFGIQPKDLSYNRGLSKEINNKINFYLTDINKKIKRLI